MMAGHYGSGTDYIIVGCNHFQNCQDFFSDSVSFGWLKLDLKVLFEHFWVSFWPHKKLTLWDGDLQSQILTNSNQIQIMRWLSWMTEGMCGTVTLLPFQILTHWDKQLYGKTLKNTVCTHLGSFFLSGIPQHCRFSCRTAGFRQSVWSSFVLGKKKKEKTDSKMAFASLKAAEWYWIQICPRCDDTGGHWTPYFVSNQPERGNKWETAQLTGSVKEAV